MGLENTSRQVSWGDFSFELMQCLIHLAYYVMSFLTNFLKVYIGKREKQTGHFKDSVSHLEYRQGAPWDMNQPVAQLWEAQKGVLLSETGRELDHAFVFILVVALFVWFVQQHIWSSVQWAHVWKTFQWCCVGPQLEIPALKAWDLVCGFSSTGKMALWLPV